MPNCVADMLSQHLAFPGPQAARWAGTSKGPLGQQTAEIPAFVATWHSLSRPGTQVSVQAENRPRYTASLSQRMRNGCTSLEPVSGSP
jgi:hypothetical protein